MQMGVTKINSAGGMLATNVTVTPTRNEFFVPPLNPETPSSTTLSYTQPLLQGGVRVDQAPIVISRIDTERSFFQLKDSLQQSVRGVVEAYWAWFERGRCLGPAATGGPRPIRIRSCAGVARGKNGNRGRCGSGPQCPGQFSRKPDYGRRHRAAARGGPAKSAGRAAGEPRGNYSDHADGHAAIGTRLAGDPQSGGGASAGHHRVEADSGGRRPAFAGGQESNASAIERRGQLQLERAGRASARQHIRPCRSQQFHRLDAGREISRSPSACARNAPG